MSSQTVLKMHSTHSYLIENKEKIAKIANISPHYIFTSAKEYCTEDDFIWVSNYIQQHNNSEPLFFNGKRGVFYSEEDVVEKFSALCGLFIRYFLDARLVGPYLLLHLLKEGTSPNIVFLHGLEYIQFEIKSDLVQFLMNSSFSVVLNVQDKVLFRKIYGDHFYQYLLNNYLLMI